jgi:hypothetical protein
MSIVNPRRIWKAVSHMTLLKESPIKFSPKPATKASVGLQFCAYVPTTPHMGSKFIVYSESLFKGR